MTTVNIHEAKTHFSRLVARAAAGETIVIARSGVPVATLSGVDASWPREDVRLGFLAGQFTIPEDFDTMDADEIADLFESGR
jgi:prevent-host-death family protein